MISLSSIAPCGMNCGICIGHMRDNNICIGCNTKNRVKPKSCLRCSIFKCEIRLKEKLKYCFSCYKYPCKRLKDLDKRYRTRYGMSMIENLEKIKLLGIRNFVKLEKERWKCNHCGSILCVHKDYCLHCGGLRKKAVFADQ